MNALGPFRVEPRAGRFRDGRLADLPALLQAGDLLVVNDAATLPASLLGRTERGEPVEARLLGAPLAAEDGAWPAALLGRGDWHARTEDRPPPPPLAPGATLAFAGGLGAAIERLSRISPRLVDLRFDRTGAALWTALYRAGRPVQYSYLDRPLDLWDVQTAFAARPLAAEAPSAGLPLSTGLLAALRARGVRLARVTHAAGLSSTGERAVDARLPLPERSEVPPETAAAVSATLAARGRVVAVGTSVVRALEGAAAADGVVRPGVRIVEIRIGPERPPTVVSGLLTGMHEPGTSHRDLLVAFVPRALLDAAYAHAEAAGYRGHELGDAMLAL